MSRRRVIHRCTECAVTHPKWSGRCLSCGAWNSLIEEVEDVGRAAGASPGRPMAQARPITEVDSREGTPVATAVPELDRVLGGGLVPGSVTLVGGEPGIGKSTLLLQVAAALARHGHPVLYVSAEESAAQVRHRAERLGAMHDGLWLLSETELPGILAALDEIGPALVVVDSIQTVIDPEIASSAGSVVQVRESAHRLVQEAKRRGVAIVLVGHVTKDGSLAGPRVLEHVVDTVISFEGDRHHALRLLRAVKHRYGPTSELGVFEMSESGLIGVADASGLFLADRCVGIPGSAVVPTLEGHRPLLVEVQALVASTNLPTPRRAAQGFDQGRLALLVAVLANRVGLAVADRDVYASVVGGVRLSEPGSDLGICLALASALGNTALAPDLIACAEVGLGGELRQVGQTTRRLAEASRLGFRRAIVPASAPDVPRAALAGDGGTTIELLRAGSVEEAICLAGLPVRSPPRERDGGPRRDGREDWLGESAVVTPFGPPHARGQPVGTLPAKARASSRPSADSSR
ncbi:MAG TPA: DNA repair protein RadA [Acidimicrobiales bacterium]|nr:DNA repair protein RadA [Acidimicrobiales bacterium]